jgi:hypothetical protein
MNRGSCYLSEDNDIDLNEESSYFRKGGEGREEVGKRQELSIHTTTKTRSNHPVRSRLAWETEATLKIEYHDDFNSLSMSSTARRTSLWRNRGTP